MNSGVGCGGPWARNLNLNIVSSLGRSLAWSSGATTQPLPMTEYITRNAL